MVFRPTSADVSRRLRHVLRGELSEYAGGRNGQPASVRNCEYAHDASRGTTQVRRPDALQSDLSQGSTGKLTNTIAVNPNYHVPYAMIWNTSIEYNLFRSTFVEVMYTGTRGVHLDELLGFSLA